jgi:ubiquinone/menaquinone biosynthesis C-methylase UbiE
MGDPSFRTDLYQGTAGYYDRFRVPYPRRLIDDLAERAGADGTGRLLDLACGPGPISFALRDRFAEVWAVDQEPDMIGFARQKAAAAGLTNIRFLAGAAEDVPVPDGSFDLVAIGNAFHRLPREAVAARVFRWLRPGGCLALLWGGSPWPGPAPWQQAMQAIAERWRARAQIEDRLPAAWAEARRSRPDQDILRDAGFELAGSYSFPVAWEWTPDSLIGFAYSTSILARPALGDLAADFEADLRREVGACEPSGVLPQPLELDYELARRPA